jgi:RNA recognition motif-containing protein
MSRTNYTRIIFGNLSYSVTEDELKAEISKYVTPILVEIPRLENDRSKGMAIVDVNTADDADTLQGLFHRQMLFGRRCYISFSSPSASRSHGDESRHGSRSRRSRDRRDSPPARRHRRSRDYSDSDYSDDSPPRKRRHREKDRRSSPRRRRRSHSSDYSSD